MAYDSKCFELAEHFLSDCTNPMARLRTRELAQHIQDEIEIWLEAEEIK